MSLPNGPSSNRSRGMVLRTGVHREMEDAANELLRQSLSTVTRHADKSDVLTPWKEQSRRSREVFVTSGTPDPALRRGNFHRAYNGAAPHLNSVEGFSPSKQARPQDARLLETGAFTPTVSWDSE